MQWYSDTCVRLYTLYLSLGGSACSIVSEDLVLTHQFTTSLPRPSEALFDGKAETQTPCLAVVLCCQNSLLNWLSIEIKPPKERHSKLLGLSIRSCRYAHGPCAAPTRPRSVSFFAWFSHHIFQTQSFQEKCHVHFHVLVALKLLVPLNGRRIVCMYLVPLDRRWLFSLFSHHISRTQSFQEKRPI